MLKVAAKLWSNWPAWSIFTYDLLKLPFLFILGILLVIASFLEVAPRDWLRLSLLCARHLGILDMNGDFSGETAAIYLTGLAGTDPSASLILLALRLPPLLLVLYTTEQ